MINGKQLVEHGIITNVPEENIQQVGIDLNLMKIEVIRSDVKVGFIPRAASKKTQLPHYEEWLPIEKNGKKIWDLQPGVYSVTFDQGCDIPNNVFTLIRQRSSLLRNGVILHSSVFDPGFKTEKIGTCIVVFNNIEIEVGARIAQMYGHVVENVQNLYNGQWQGDKQRNEKAN